MPLLNLVLNIVWLVFAGFWMAVGYAAAGILCFIFIVTIPLGVAAFRMANYSFWPFGRTLVPTHDAGAGAGALNIVWIVFFGWWLALGHILTGISLCLTIIGIPMGIASFKMVPVSLVPYGKEIVPTRQVAARQSWGSYGPTIR
ncbi:YccF domain-containing protein [Actinomycetota bacterium]